MAATKITPEVVEKRRLGIIKAKSSPEHREKMSKISKKLWENKSFRDKHLNRVPWNKLDDKNKIEKSCLVCNTKFLVVPSHATTRKCCSKKCANQYKRITPHINWNPLS